MHFPPQIKPKKLHIKKAIASTEFHIWRKKSSVYLEILKQTCTN